MEKEQLQAIKERFQDALQMSRGRLGGKTLMHDALKVVAEVERLQQALESVETACYSESNYIEIAKMARQALEGKRND